MAQPGYRSSPKQIYVAYVPTPIDVIDDKTHPYLERNQSFYQKCAKIVCPYPVLGTQQLDSLESAVHKHPKIGRIARYTLQPPRSQLATTARL